MEVGVDGSGKVETEYKSVWVSRIYAKLLRGSSEKVCRL